MGAYNRHKESGSCSLADQVKLVGKTANSNKIIIIQSLKNGSVRIRLQDDLNILTIFTVGITLI